jgi:hypothetical protein
MFRCTSRVHKECTEKDGRELWADEVRRTGHPRGRSGYLPLPTSMTFPCAASIAQRVGTLGTERIYDA